MDAYTDNNSDCINRYPWREYFGRSQVSARSWEQRAPGQADTAGAPVWDWQGGLVDSSGLLISPNAYCFTDVQIHYFKCNTQSSDGDEFFFKTKMFFFFYNIPSYPRPLTDQNFNKSIEVSGKRKKWQVYIWKSILVIPDNMTTRYQWGSTTTTSGIKSKLFFFKVEQRYQNWLAGIALKTSRWKQSVCRFFIFSISCIQIYTKSISLYHDSKSIPWVLYTKSLSLYHESKSIPWIQV